MRQPRILIVDDSAANCALFTEMMTRLGCDVDAVEDSAIAVQAIEKGSYDIVFLDFQMPGMSGMDIAWEIQRMCAKKMHMYVISGALPTEEEEKQFSRLGIRKHLLKPLCRDVLQGVLKECGFESIHSYVAQTGFSAEILNVYAGELRVRGADCVKLCAESDMKGLAREAHTIRSLAETLGILDLGQYAAMLEDMADQGHAATISAFAEEVRSACVNAAESILKEN